MAVLPTALHETEADIDFKSYLALCTLDCLQFVFLVCCFFTSIPTDCPQRERRGWLGDAQLSAETTLNNFDMGAPYTKFLRDIRDAQVGPVQDIP